MKFFSLEEIALMCFFQIRLPNIPFYFSEYHLQPRNIDETNLIDMSLHSRLLERKSSYPSRELMVVLKMNRI